MKPKAWLCFCLAGVLQACGGEGSTEQGSALLSPSPASSQPLPGGSAPPANPTPSPASPAPTTPNTPPAPTSATLLHVADLHYAGAFRMPAAQYGESSLNYAQGVLAVDARQQQLLVVGHDQEQGIARFDIPAHGADNSVAALPLASPPRDGFVRIFNRVANNPQAIDRISGMALVADGNQDMLVINAYRYYDAGANASDTTLVMRAPAALSSSPVSGFYAMQGATFAAGWISPLPTNWQTTFNGRYLSGHSSGEPIISRFSVGPSAYLFDPAQLAANGANGGASGTNSTTGAISTRPLLSFSLSHPLHEDLANHSRNNRLWTHLSHAVYGFVTADHRSYVTIGHSGGHQSGVCYKCTPAGETEPCPGYCANDAADYSPYIWLWDLDDLAAVAHGDKAPWEVRPYEYGPLTLPFGARRLGGASYDATTGRLYLSALNIDRTQGPYSTPPVIMVLTLGAASQ